MFVFLFVLLLCFIIFLYRSYVFVVKARNQLDEALSGIDVQLKKRADLVPNILKTAQKFMTHEKEMFTEITKLRTDVFQQSIGTAKRFDTETKLQDSLKQFIMSVENYPQLKSSDAMINAMETLNETEENIAASRRFYNSALRQLNDKVKIFPYSLFKVYAGDVSGLSYFKASEKEKNSIDVNDYL